MPGRRPFQFGLKAILVFTFLVAVLAWLARGLGQEGSVVWLPYVCLGLIQCVLAYRLRRELRRREVDARRRDAVQAALFVFLLTMAAYVAFVASLLLSRIGIETPFWALLLVPVAQLLILPAGVIVTVFSCMNYPGQRDWQLNLLELLNLLNPVYMLSVFFGAFGP
jgi:hypothetical protein